MDSWIQTFTGKHIDVFNPKVEDIDIIDIAHALAMKCRFNGHSNSFYSVAEHCVRMTIWPLPGDVRLRLMHDAAEAYIPDVSTPIKERLNFHNIIEDNLFKIISLKFQLPLYNNDIRKADQIMLATEIRDLMNDPKDWGLQYQPYSSRIKPWRWQHAKKIFLLIAEGVGLK